MPETTFDPPKISYERSLEEAKTLPLDEVDPSRWDYFEHDTIGHVFERMRREAPIHYCKDSHHGPFWSVTRWQDIRDVELDVETFSSAPAIALVPPPAGITGGFIAQDPPEHDDERRVVRPAVSRANLRFLEATIRERAGAMLDALPMNEIFDWVDRVSVELTTQMLATLFDFPFEERRRLTRWSDIATGGPHTGIVSSRAEAMREFGECLEIFQALWEERAIRPPANDLISMLAHSPATQKMIDEPGHYLGNIMLLIVGGNDTTRNSISGGVLALDRFPDEFEKLRANPSLIPNMVSEIVRWQTPLAYMRRTATRDTELRGQKIREGDKVAMWYLSANRDEDIFHDADRLIIDRPNVKAHLSFGFGLHRCVGEHLALMQLRVLWEEILERFSRIEVVAEPIRARSSFVRGYTELMVRVHPK